MVAQPASAKPKASQGRFATTGTTRGVRGMTRADAKENEKAPREENVKLGMHSDTPKMSSKPQGNSGEGQRTSNRLQGKSGERQKNINRSQEKTVDRKLKGRMNVKEEVMKGSGEGRKMHGRKSPTEDPGRRSILKDSQKMVKDTRKEEQEGEEKMEMVENDEEEEDEELDFSAIERKIFEGHEVFGRLRSKPNRSVLCSKRKRPAMLKEDKDKGGTKKEESEEKAAKITPGNMIKNEARRKEDSREKSLKKEENREKIYISSPEDLRRGIKEEEKQERPATTSLRTRNKGSTMEKVAIRPRKGGETKQKLVEMKKGSVREEEKESSGEEKRESAREKRESAREKRESAREKKRESAREKRGREPAPRAPQEDRKSVSEKLEEDNEGKTPRTSSQARGKTDTRRTENRDQRKSRTTRQTEIDRENMKGSKMPKTDKLLKKNREKIRDEEEEEGKKTRGKRKEKEKGWKGKQEERGTGKGRSHRRGRNTGKTAAATVAASDSELSDWEEVGEMEGVDEVKELLSQATSSSSQNEGGGGGGGVKIELDAPETLWGIKRRKRRTDEELIEQYLRRRVNETIRKVTKNEHKAHLLCLLAYGRHLNTALGSGTVLGAALSTTPGRAAHPKGRLDLTHLQRLVEWFCKKFPRKDNELEKDYWETPVEVILVRRFGSGEVRSVREAVLCFVALCRSLGISARLVLSLQPLPWKPAPGTLIKPTKGEGQESTKVGDSDKDSKPPASSSSSLPAPSKNLNPEQQKNPGKKPNRKMLSSDSETSPVDQSKRSRGTRGGGGGGGGGKRRKTEDEEEEDEVEDEDEDSDFMVEDTKYRMPRRKSQTRRVSQEGGGGKRKKEGEAEGKKKRKTEALVEWVEVFVEEEEKWVCVDVTRGKIHCVSEIEARMPSGSSYITAFNPDLTVKDVTQRYVSSWLSAENKLRCCSEWWAKALHPFQGAKTRKDEEEDEEMEKALHLQPLPKTVAEYKNHPLYVLQRHLLKFEAIYPPDISPVGFFKGDPVFPRSSVHNLHSRDVWLKEAKSVRVGEEAYKTVKARPKWDRVTCQIIKDRPLEVFGEWQVEDYEPPVASGGKVPKNEYGNVELFKPSMVPRGCVHIPVTGINKVARKLNIDCAPAMVGFDFHSGWTHPVFEGYVVCEEFKDVLMDAWNQEQERQLRRAEEKRLKRVYDSWRRLIKGVMVRERVRQDYQLTSDEEQVEEEEQEEQDKRKTKNKKKKKEDRQSVEGDTSNEGRKRKVRQFDIDALETEKENREKDDKGGGGKEEEENNDPSPSSFSPQHHPPKPLITHQVRNLSIDLTSNVVEMAKKSRQRTMKTKNTARRLNSQGRKKGTGGGQGKGQKDQEKGELAGLSEESEESDEEAKKEKIRAILSWDKEGHGPDPDLSDDSDGAGNGGDGDTGDSGDGGRGKEQPSSFFLGFSGLSGAKQLSLNARKEKGGKKEKRGRGAEPETESDASTSWSTTPEPDIKAHANPDGPKRKLSLRLAKRSVKTYKEEGEEESEGDISLDESDIEDKSYQPLN